MHTSPQRTVRCGGARRQRQSIAKGKASPATERKDRKSSFWFFSIFDAALFGYVWCEYCGMGCLICLRGELAGSLKTDSVVLQLLRPLAGAGLAVHEVGYVDVPSN